MIRLRGLIAIAVLFELTTLSAPAEGLGVGDAAPKLTVKEFVKGEAIKEFEKGKVYVVEFWATWCPPCKDTIRHLTKLQKKHLEKVRAGQWDLKAAAAEFAAVKKVEARRAADAAKAEAEKEKARRLIATLPEAEQAVAKAMVKLGGKIKGNESIVAVDLQSTRVTDTDLKELKGLKKLQRLVLTDTKVTDAGLKELKDLKKLQVLLLSGTQTTDAGLKDLQELKKLQELELANTQVTDAGMKDLKELKKLQQLNLQSTRVTDAGLKELQELKHLQFLILARTRVTDAGLKELQELKHLQFLILAGTQVTDVGLENLKGLKNLAWLSLERTPVTGTGLKHLKDLKNLQLLDLRSSRVTDAGLMNLKDLKSGFMVVNIDKGTKVTNKGVDDLKKVMPSILIDYPYPQANAASRPLIPIKEVRVTAPARIDWRFVARVGSWGLDPGADNYDSRQQRYKLYVPKNYNATKAWPLVVFIDSGDGAGWWSHWQEPCKKLGIFYCVAYDAGNSCPPSRRARIVLDMLDDVRRHYRIDPNQTYVSGESGGGRMACAIGYALPEYFGGVIPICGTQVLPWSMPYLRHRIHDRQSVAFVTGTHDMNRPEYERYMMPLFQDLGIRSKLWIVPMAHDVPGPEVLTEVLQWMVQDLSRKLADAKARPSLAVTPDEAPAAKLQAARQLEAAYAEAKRPERLWQAAALAQGILERWGQSPSAESARKFLEDLRSDPRQAALLEERRRADEWRVGSARARVQEQFGGKTTALKNWQAMAQKYAKRPEGKKAKAEVKRLEAIIAALPRLPSLGIALARNTVKLGQVEKDGPAHKAGLQLGDIIVKFDGKTVETDDELIESIQKRKPGDKVRIEVQRDGKPLTVTVQLGGRLPQEELPFGW